MHGDLTDLEEDDEHAHGVVLVVHHDGVGGEGHEEVVP